MNDPVILAIIGGALALVLLSVIGGIRRRFREAAQRARMRSAVRRQRDLREQEQAEFESLASRITATSSTDSIAGFVIVRQIEAVFTDGHATPSDAVQALKAVSAEKGANGILNLHTTRPPGGKYMAYGDAVIVRPAGNQPGPPNSKDISAMPEPPASD